MLFAVSAFSQEDSLQTSNSNKLIYKISKVNHTLNVNDTNYIQKTSSKWVVGIKSSNWLDSYNIETGEATGISLKSDLCYNLGFSIGYKFLSLGYSVNLTNTFSKQTAGNEWDFGINYNRFGLDAYYLNNSGNTMITGYTDATSQQDLYQPFDGLTTKMFGVDLTYFFNHSRYSNAAAYNNYATKQHKSAGSLIVGASFSRQKLFLDFSKLSDEIASAELKTVENANLLYSNYCISIGYGYNYTFAKKWLINLTDIPSAGIKNQHIKIPEDNSSSNLSIMNRVKFALVYNADHYYGGFNCFYTTNFYSAKHYTLSNSLGVFNLFVGFRFT